MRKKESFSSSSEAKHFIPDRINKFHQLTSVLITNGALAYDLYMVCIMHTFEDEDEDVL